MSCAVLVFAATVANAGWWSFENRSYYDPQIAGVRDPNFAALVPAYFDRMAMMVDRDRSRIG